MPDERPHVTILHRREIEAKVLGPVIRAFAEAVGVEKATEVLRGVIADLARKDGADLARSIGESSLEAFASTIGRWTEGGALEIDVLERSPERFSYNVTRCRYAEMYERLGMRDLGVTLSCQRDFTLAEGFNPEFKLERTQTIMEGAPFCDFRYRRTPKPPDEAE